MKANILVDFQICISVHLNEFAALSMFTWGYAYHSFAMTSLKLSMSHGLFSQALASKSPHIPKSKMFISREFGGENATLTYFVQCSSR